MKYKSIMSNMISELRKKKGMTQEELGHTLGVSTQAVSRWECGGLPDIELLPSIADIFGVSIDTLFGRSGTEKVSSEQIIENDILATPAEDRFTRGHELCLRILRSIIRCHEQSTASVQHFIEDLSSVDRSLEDIPERAMHLLLLSDDRGIAQASIAKDFKYILLMPEPENSFSSIMKCKEDMHLFFNMLVKPNRLEMLIYLYSRKACSFTAGLAAGSLGITEAEALEILMEFEHFCISEVTSIDTVNGTEKVFNVRVGCEFVPFLYFTSEMMRNDYFPCITWLCRRNPYFADELGKNGYNSKWHYSKDETELTCFGPVITVKDENSKFRR